MLVLENDAKATGGVRQALIYEILQKDMVLEKGCVGFVLGIFLCSGRSHSVLRSFKTDGKEHV